MARRANIGSAVNDTTRELGGALGVAVVGSIVSSIYAGRLADAPEVVRESLGAAVQAAAFAEPARDAFVHAMSRASIVVAVVAGLGAAVPAYAGASTRWSCDSQCAVSCAASRSAAGPKQVPRMNTSVWSSQLVE